MQYLNPLGTLIIGRLGIKATMITIRQVKSVLRQMASMILAIVGSSVLIGTLGPFLNPGKWRIAREASGGSAVPEWTWVQYLTFCLIGFSVSAFILACAWRLNDKHASQAKTTPRTVFFWLVVFALIGVFLLL
jgi:multisubunit Na+/H+ antiporter MnhC subunit